MLLSLLFFLFLCVSYISFICLYLSCSNFACSIASLLSIYLPASLFPVYISLCLSLLSASLSILSIYLFHVYVSLMSVSPVCIRPYWLISCKYDLLLIKEFHHLEMNCIAKGINRHETCLLTFCNGGICTNLVWPYYVCVNDKMFSLIITYLYRYAKWWAVYHH